MAGESEDRGAPAAGSEPGRLHLKWGAALLWAGDKAGAAKQFAVASQLDLTSSERSEIARMRELHG